MSSSPSARPAAAARATTTMAPERPQSGGGGGDDGNEEEEAPLSIDGGRGNSDEVARATPIVISTEVRYEPYEDQSHLATDTTTTSNNNSSSSSSSYQQQHSENVVTTASLSSLLARTGGCLSRHSGVIEGMRAAGTGMSSAPSSSVCSAAIHGLSSGASFPAKLHEILKDPEVAPELISWLPHGRAFKVHNQPEFERRALPKYFRHGRFASFLRQVNGWGFRRVLSGRDENAYYHEYFLRGLPQLSQRMKRNSSTVNSSSGARQQDSRQASFAETRASIASGAIIIPPDFYHISELHPLPEADGTWPEGRDPRQQPPPESSSVRGIPSAAPSAAHSSSAPVSSTTGNGPSATTSSGQASQPLQQQTLQAAGISSTSPDGVLNPAATSVLQQGGVQAPLMAEDLLRARTQGAVLQPAQLAQAARVQPGAASTSSSNSSVRVQGTVLPQPQLAQAAGDQPRAAGTSSSISPMRVQGIVLPQPQLAQDTIVQPAAASDGTWPEGRDPQRQPSNESSSVGGIHAAAPSAALSSLPLVSSITGNGLSAIASSGLAGQPLLQQTLQAAGISSTSPGGVLNSAATSVLQQGGVQAPLTAADLLRARTQGAVLPPAQLAQAARVQHDAASTSSSNSSARVQGAVLTHPQLAQATAVQPAAAGALSSLSPALASINVPLVVAAPSVAQPSLLVQNPGTGGGGGVLHLPTINIVNADGTTSTIPLVGGGAAAAAAADLPPTATMLQVISPSPSQASAATLALPLPQQQQLQAHPARPQASNAQLSADLMTQLGAAVAAGAPAAATVPSGPMLQVSGADPNRAATLMALLSPDSAPGLAGVSTGAQLPVVLSHQSTNLVQLAPALSGQSSHLAPPQQPQRQTHQQLLLSALGGNGANIQDLIRLAAVGANAEQAAANSSQETKEEHEPGVGAPH